jgi:hypothetical protein
MVLLSLRFLHLKKCPKIQERLKLKTIQFHTQERFVVYTPRPTITKFEAGIVSQTRIHGDLIHFRQLAILWSMLPTWKNKHFTSRLESSNGKPHHFRCIIHWYMLISAIDLPTFATPTWLQNMFALVFSSQDCWLCIPLCTGFVWIVCMYVCTYVRTYVRR